MRIRTATPLLTAILLLATTACSHEAQDEWEASVITFTVADQQQATRAGDATLTGDFRVLAWQHEDDEDPTLFIGSTADGTTYQGETASYDGTLWRTATTYLWPAAYYTVDFYALWPATLTGIRMQAVDGTAYRTITDYEVSTTDTDDLMFAAVSSSLRKARSKDGAVDLGFCHALSRVSFQLFSSNDVTATVGTLIVRNVCRQGSLRFSNTPTGTAADATWYGQTSAADIVCPNAAGASGPFDASGISPQLILLPQTTAEAVSVVVSCKVQRVDDGEYLKGSADSYADVEMTLTTAWQPGRSYVYQIMASGDGLRLLNTITPWTTGTNDYDDTKPITIQECQIVRWSEGSTNWDPNVMPGGTISPWTTGGTAYDE